ncbi:hypothetical protein L9F63_000909, partial [Diploptera punctata]
LVKLYSNIENNYNKLYNNYNIKHEKSYLFSIQYFRIPTSLIHLSHAYAKDRIVANTNYDVLNSMASSISYKSLDYLTENIYRMRFPFRIRAEI